MRKTTYTQRNRHLLLDLRDNMDSSIKEFRQKKPYSKHHLVFKQIVLLDIDYYAVAQYLYMKKIPLRSMPNIQYQTNLFLQQHHLTYNHKRISIDYNKTVHNLDQIVDGLYPSVPIFFIRNKARVVSPKDYKQGNYKHLLENVLELRDKEKSAGRCVLDSFKYLRRLIRLNDRKALSFIFNVNLKDLKRKARHDVPKNVDNNKRSILVNNYYQSSIVYWIDSHFSAHQAYIIMLKILCNSDIKIHF